MRTPESFERFPGYVFRGTAAALCMVLIALGDPGLPWGRAQQAQTGATEDAQKIPNDQLDSLVAPIALYPDPLLAQVLAASTYPLEIVELQQFLTKNKDLKDKALADAVMKQDWDPTVQALAAMPDVVKRLADDIEWTTDLGNAFLAQQSDVMHAVQRMRKKAQDKGALKSDDKMKVETKVVDNENVIVIQQANPQIVYVPTYNPTVVYGPPVYPYPPVYYPPPGAYAGAALLSFGIGVAIGAAFNGGWCCGASWGGNNNITINNNNNYVRNSNRRNVNGGNRVNAGKRVNGGNTWQHNPSHRGGAPYASRGTAEKFGGSVRGDSNASRQDRARQGQGRAGARPQPAATNRASSGAGAGSRTAGGADRGGAGAANRAGGSGADSIGGRNVSRSGSGGDAFGGGSRGGYNRQNANESSRRGGSSLGSGSSNRSGGGGGVPRGGGGRR